MLGPELFQLVETKAESFPDFRSGMAFLETARRQVASCDAKPKTNKRRDGQG